MNKENPNARERPEQGSGGSVSPPNAADRMENQEMKAENKEPKPAEKRPKSLAEYKDPAESAKEFKRRVNEWVKKHPGELPKVW